MNLNDTVRVKLKPQGLFVLKAKHDELRSRFPKMEEWTPPKLDEEGYYRTQLWCLMQDFGKHIYLGCEPPFETEILEVFE